MPRRRTAGAFPLLITVDPDADEALTHQLYEAVRRLILSGRALAGSRLPSTRVLSSELRVSRNTVVNAFERLGAEGYIEACAGAGRHPHIAHAAGQDGASRSGGSTTRRRPRGSPYFAPRGGHRGDSDATMVRSIGRGPAVSSWRRRALRVSAESLEPVEPPTAGALRGGGDRLRRGRRIHAVARGHRGLPAECAWRNLRAVAGDRRKRIAAGSGPREPRPSRSGRRRMVRKPRLRRRPWRVSRRWRSPHPCTCRRARPRCRDGDSTRGHGAPCVRDAVASVSIGRHDEPCPAPRAAAVGGAIRRVDIRGRLRQRVSIHTSTAAGDARSSTRTSASFIPAASARCCFPRFGLDISSCHQRFSIRSCACGSSPMCIPRR